MEILNGLFNDYSLWVKVNVLFTVLFFVWRWVLANAVLTDTEKFLILSDKEFMVSKGKRYASFSLGVWWLCLALTWIALLISWLFI